MLYQVIFHQHFESLQNSIQWAHYADDFDVLCLAKEKMDQLIAFIGTLPGDEQQKAWMQVDEALPPEWPLWMEACRYQDREKRSAQHVVFH